MLRNAGFRQRVYDYWDLRMASEGGTVHGLMLRTIKSVALARLIAHMMFKGCAFATVK